jgi:hypothetical protein
MENLKETVISLNQIIQTINEKNCFEKVVAFFERTSYLYDNIDEIRQIPLKGRETRTVWGKIKHAFIGKKGEPYRSPEETESLKKQQFFIEEVCKGGRSEFGRNRTKKGEKVTADNVYFGDIYGLYTLPVRKWAETTDKDAQETIANQIIRFVTSYKNSFKIDWAESV